MEKFTSECPIKRDRRKLFLSIATNPEMGTAVADLAVKQFDKIFIEPVRLPRHSTSQASGIKFLSLKAVRKMLDDAGIQYVEFDSVI